MNESKVLQAIYDSEINVSISWLWDEGVEAKVFGGMISPWKFTRKFQNRNHSAICDAVQWVVERILEHDPDSGFAVRFRRGELDGANDSMVSV